MAFVVPAGFVVKATFLELEGEDCGCEWEMMSCPASFDDGSFGAPAARVEPAVLSDFELAQERIYCAVKEGLHVESTFVVAAQRLEADYGEPA
eukprot:13076281-Alexandrium_andersonii.AAC.1